MDLSSAKNLIEKYEIEKIPAIIITGEINKTNFVDFEEKKGALLFTKTSLPYTDAKTGKIKGVVSLTYISDASCDKCIDLTTLIEQIKTSVTIRNEKIIDLEEASSLVKQYNIEKIPTLILSKDLEEYKDIAALWKTIGTTEADGSYITRNITAPYLDLKKGKVVGLVDLIMLTDKSCTKCYNVTLHKPILARFGVELNSERTVDISDSEGKELVKKYNIKLVPTTILSKDADFYPALKQIWQQGGSIENDETYVFREMSAMTNIVYKNLTTGEVVG